MAKANEKAPGQALAAQESPKIEINQPPPGDSQGAAPPPDELKAKIDEALSACSCEGKGSPDAEHAANCKSWDVAESLGLDVSSRPAAPAPTPPPAKAKTPKARPPSRWLRAIIFTKDCESNTLQGFSRRKFPKGCIVVEPTEKELQFVAWGQAEPLLQFWPWFPESDPRAVQGRLWPQLMLHKPTGKLFVRSEALQLKELSECDRPLAVLTVMRCSDKRELELVPEHHADTAVRQAARERLAGREFDTRPAALGISGGMVVVVNGDGSQRSVASERVCDIDHLFELAEPELLRRLLAQDPREPLQKAIDRALFKAQPEEGAA